MIPARIARQLTERHGRLAAIRKVGARADRYRTVEHGKTVVTHPFRWLIWTTVLAYLLRSTQAEVHYSMMRHRPQRAA